MNKLLKKLLGLLFPGIDGVEDDSADLGSDSQDDPVDDVDVDLPDDDLPDDPPARAAPRRSDADERLARLEAEVERRGRMAAEARDRAPVVDHDYQREEERLRSADITELERWQIQSNRTLRATEARATQALQQAHEMQDRTRFESKFASDPRRAKYADRVEAAVEEERRAGRTAQREAVYYYMLGKDIAEGKLKSKPKASSAPAVPRGKSPGVRSDVAAKGSRTEHQKRADRLANMNI